MSATKESFLKKWFNSFRDPEVKIVWFFALPAFIIITAINFIFLPGDYLVISSILLFLLFSTLFPLGLSIGKINYQLIIEKFRTNSILSGLIDAVVVYDDEFKIILFNKAAEILFGVKKEEILNQTIQPTAVSNPKLKILAQVIFPSLAAAIIKRAADTETNQIFDLKIKELETKELRIYFSRIIGADNKPIGFIKVIHDRSREKNVLEAKTEFLTIAAHEFRTPLTAIKWAFEALVSNKDENARNVAGVGLKAANNLMEILEHLLSANKIEEGRFGYQFEKTDLISLIEKSITKYSESAGKYNIKIFFQKPALSEPLILDAEKIILVMDNLISNAIKYNTTNGQIIIAVEKLIDKPFIVISIKDTGIGIPAADQNKIFLKFFRSSNALKFQTEGIGLGLFIVRNIIKRHGGEMWFESEEKRGTTFYFSLPTDSSLIPPKETVYGEE